MMISLNNINKSYKNKKLFNNYSLDINDGDFIAITGKSGSGKTTLLNMIGLLENFDSGKIKIDGRDNFTKKDRLMIHRNKFGFLFQNYALIENKTVKDNLKIALEYKDKSKVKEIKNVLESVGLKGFEKRKIFQLSGGEQQRVALARVILKNPKYIFADEPTGNLDIENRDIVFNHLKKLNQEGKTVIFVTHDNNLASMAKKSIYLD